MREDIFNQFNINKSPESGVPCQNLWKAPNTYSLNKFIDTPSREITDTSLLLENNPPDFNTIFNDKEEGFSQESTSEENPGNAKAKSTNLIRNMSVKTSEQFTSWKQIDFENFCK